eukprot:jgi/Bigna1/143226/aug1.77_g17934
MKVSTGGTLEWSPPEQFSSECGHKSDVWGLGLVMHHLVEMRMPFEGVSQSVLESATKNGRLKCDKMDETDPILKETTKLCLNTDRTKRPKAGQLAEGLNKIAPKMSSLQFLKQLGLDDEAEELKEKLEMAEKNKEEAVREAEARAEAKREKLPKEKQKAEAKAEADERKLLKEKQEANNRIRELEEKLERISRLSSPKEKQQETKKAIEDHLKEGWKKIPDVNAERNGLGVAVGDGKLFAVGGCDGSNRLKSGECLDLKNVDAGWKKLPDVNTERSGLGVAVGDGKLFAVGGQDEDENDLKSGEHLDLKNVDAGWKKLPDVDAERRQLGVAVGDGKLFAVGGHCHEDGGDHLKSGEHLDLKNVDAGWKKLPDVDTERGALGVAVGDGKLFAVGGHDDGDCHKSGEHLDLKNVDAGWKKLSDVNATRVSLGVAVGDGKLFAVGGSDGDRLKSGEHLRIAVQTASAHTPGPVWKKCGHL